MSYTLGITSDIGTAGLTLKCALTTSLASSVPKAAPYRDMAFSEIGQGFYQIDATLPSHYSGSLMVYTGTLGSAAVWTGVSILASLSINPQETEPDSQSAETPAAPTDVTLCRIYGILVSQATGRPMIGAQLTASRVPGTAAFSGGILVGHRKTAISDGSGLVVLDVARTDEISLQSGGSVQWRIVCVDAGIDVTTSLTDSTYNLGDLFP